MKSEELKKIIPKWAASIGRSEALIVLLRLGIGHSTAVLLIKGTYVSELKERLISLLSGALSDYINKQ